MAAYNFIKLGFVLNASDKMSKVIDGAVKDSLQNVKKMEKTFANVGKSSLMMGKRMTAMGASISGAMFLNVFDLIA